MRLIDADALKRKAQKVATESWKMRITARVETVLNQFIDWIDNAPSIQSEPHWISCSERLPKKYGEYIITWITSCAPNKRFVGLAEYDAVNEWDIINGRYNGGWSFEGYMQSCPDVKVIAWMPLPEPYQKGRE